MALSVLVDWTRTTLIPQSPTDITGLALWWRARDLSTLADGAAISSWTSAVGTSTASQGTGSKQPTKQTVAGRTVVRFDGSNDDLTLDGDALTVSKNVTGLTVMARAKVTPAAATKRIVMLSTGTDATASRIAIYVNASDLFTTSGRRLDADAADTLSGSAPGSTLVRVFTATQDYTNTDAFLYLDGTQDATDSTWLTAGSSSNTNSLGAALGSRADGTAEFLAMDLYDVLVWPRVLTTTEREAAEAYLRSGGELTSRVLANPGVTLEYGRDQSTALAPTIAGRGSFTLNNASGDYTPLNSSSPLYGFIKPARPVRIQRTVGANTYTLFAGHTDDTTLSPDFSNRSVSVSLVDFLADFRNLTISTALYAGKFTGEIIDIILDEAGWEGGRTLDQGGTVVSYWWEDGTDALEALEKVIRSEGPPAYLTVGADGSIIFKDRHHRLIDSGSITSQDTWFGATTEPVISAPMVYDDGWRNIVNHGLVEGNIRQLQELEPIWTGDSFIKFSASETKTFIASTSDPFQDATVPVSGTDYIIDAGAFSSVTLSRTSGASTILTMTATGAGAKIRDLQVRARPVTVTYTQQVTASDSASIADYGQRSFPTDLPFSSIYDAQAILDTVVEQRAQPLTVVQVPFVIQSTTRANDVLTRDLSDRVTINVTAASLNNDFYIESFAHNFGTELDHTVTVGCEILPPAGTVTAANVFILGSGGAHDLGDGKLAA